MPPSQKKTFVKFTRLRRERGVYARDTLVTEVKGRDLKSLPLPASADFFMFFDTDPARGDAVLNPSPLHIVGEKLLTREEAKLLLAPDINTHAQIKWDMKLETHDLFTVTRSNHLEPVAKDNIVINSRREQLYPAPQPQAPCPPIRMDLKDAVEAPPRAKFRPKPPHH